MSKVLLTSCSFSPGSRSFSLQKCIVEFLSRNFWCRMEAYTLPKVLKCFILLHDSVFKYQDMAACPGTWYKHMHLGLFPMPVSTICGILRKNSPGLKKEIELTDKSKWRVVGETRWHHNLRTCLLTLQNAFDKHYQKRKEIFCDLCSLIKVSIKHPIQEDSNGF